MQSFVPPNSTETLSDKQRAALVSLLTDDDPNIYRIIRGRILAQGQEAGSWLRNYELSDDPVLRRRVKEIVSHLDRQRADDRFLAFCKNQAEDLDVEFGSWLLGKTRYPEINPLAYQALMDSYAGELLDRIDFGSEPEDILGEINRFLFVELGYTGNEQDFYDPQNSYLNRVVDRRLGNPISLSLIYLFVARRLRLPVTGIGMPGHFLCRFQSTTREIFIDPFNKGKLLTRAQCIRCLQDTIHDYQERFLSPATHRRILLRVCSNLLQIYVNLEQLDEQARLQRYIVCLSK